MEPKEIEIRLIEIETRNKRVESNKRWETSYTRRGSIAVLTYVSIVCYHLIIGAKNVMLVSAVQVLGFILATLSLQVIRSLFEKNEINLSD